MVRSLLAVESVPIPFPPDRTLMMRLPLTEGHYPTPEKRNVFVRDLLDRVRAIPGVSMATVDAAFPFLDMDGERVQITGQPEDKRVVSMHLTSPEFLALSEEACSKDTLSMRAKSQRRRMRWWFLKTLLSATSRRKRNWTHGASARLQARRQEQVCRR